MKYEIGSEAKNWPSILGAPNSTSSGRVITYNFLLKKSYHQIGIACRCKGVETDLSRLTNHQRRFQASYTTDWRGL